MIVPSASSQNTRKNIIQNNNQNKDYNSLIKSWNNDSFKNSMQNIASKPTSLSFGSKIKKILRGSLPEGLASKIDMFEETHDSSIAKELGRGLFAVASRFNETDFVIKESLGGELAKKANGNFHNEAKFLEEVEGMKNTQHLVAQVVTEKDNYFLISTMVNGKSANPQENPLKPLHFKTILKTLGDLDKREVYQNDLNTGNCFIKPNGDSSLLDYQFAVKIKPNDSSYNDLQLNTPSFMMPSNAVMYECSNLPFYLMKLDNDDAKSLFKGYLRAKSNFHEDRATMLQKKYGDTSKMKDAIKYEKLMGHFLKKPSEEMTKLQALKLQVHYGFRQAFTITDKNNPIITNKITAPLIYHSTAASAKNFADYAKELKSNPPSNVKGKEKEYFNDLMNYEIKYGNYWRDKMMESGEESLWQVYRNATGKTWSTIDNISHNINQFDDLSIDSISNVSEKILGKTSESPKSSHYVEYDIRQVFKNIAKEINKADKKERPIDKKYSKELRKINKLKDKLHKSFKDSFVALNDGKMVASLLHPLKTIYYGRLLNEEAEKLYNKTPVGSEAESYSIVYRKLGEYVKEKMPDAADDIIERTQNTINDVSSFYKNQLKGNGAFDVDIKTSSGTKFKIGDELRFDCE